MKIIKISNIKPKISSIRNYVQTRRLANCIKNGKDEFVKDLGRKTAIERNTRVYSILLAGLLACISPINASKQTVSKQDISEQDISEQDMSETADSQAEPQLLMSTMLKALPQEKAGNDGGDIYYMSGEGVVDEGIDELNLPKEELQADDGIIPQSQMPAEDGNEQSEETDAEDGNEQSEETDAEDGIMLLSEAPVTEGNEQSEETNAEDGIMLQSEKPAEEGNEQSEETKADENEQKSNSARTANPSLNVQVAPPQSNSTSDDSDEIQDKDNTDEKDELNPKKSESNLEPPKLTVQEILEHNQEVKEAYEKLLEAGTTFSNELNREGLKLIEERVNALGEGKVNKLHVLIILYLESRGGVYKEGTKDLAENKTSHARGPFQIKPETFEGIKERNKVDLDYNDAYDNLDACIYLLKYIHERRSKEVASGKTLPTGEDFDNALAWSYHDGAYAKKVGSAGKKYVKNFASLNILRDYPEVVDYLFNQTLLQ